MICQRLWRKELICLGQILTFGFWQIYFCNDKHL